MGAALACIVIARHYHIHVPIFSGIPELHLPRMSGPLGNPTYLSVCMLFNLLLALGFVVRSWLPAPQPAPAPEPQRRGGRRQGASSRQSAGAGARWPARLLWAAAAALLFWGLALAGSVGGFLGLFAGIGFAALGHALLGRGRVRWIAVAALAALVLAGAGIGMRAVDSDRTAALTPDRPIAGYVLSTHIQRPGVQSRLAAWEAGLEGLAARPVLGWGPENFGAAFGRFASGYGAFAEPHDQAHGKLVEVAATTGVPGLLAWLALWAAAILVLWRAARGMAGHDRAFAVFAGAALFGALVQGQFLFDIAVGMLQTVLLLGFAVSLEAVAVPEGRRPRLPARLSWRWLPGAATGRPGSVRARIAAGAVAVGLATAGLTVNQAIYDGADLDHLPRPDWSWRNMGGGIEGFPPLANTWRWWLFNELALHWPRIRAEDGARARRLLDWAGKEAEEAVRTEPAHWRIRQSLARMYRAAAATDPGYEARAGHHLERARALAPNRAVFPSALAPPGGLALRRLDDGRHELAWRPSPGAGYHAVERSRNRGRLAFRLSRLRPRHGILRSARKRPPGPLQVPDQGVPLPRQLQSRRRMAAGRRAGRPAFGAVRGGSRRAGRCRCGPQGTARPVARRRRHRHRDAARRASSGPVGRRVAGVLRGGLYRTPRRADGGPADRAGEAGWLRPP